MQCPNCEDSVDDTETVCPNCQYPLTGPEFPYHVDVADDHRGGILVELFPGPEDDPPLGQIVATDEEEMLREEFDDAAPGRHPSHPKGEPAMTSSRNYYLIMGYFGGSSVKQEEHWVQASTDGVAKKVLRDYAKVAGWALNPAKGQPAFPNRDVHPGKYYAAKDAALEVLEISHQVPRKFIFREHSKSDPVMVTL